MKMKRVITVLSLVVILLGMSVAITYSVRY